MILAERTVASRFLWRISIHCMDCIEVVNEKLFHTHGLFITFNWKSFSQQKNIEHDQVISRGDVNPTEIVGIFDATNLIWIFMETRSYWS